MNPSEILKLRLYNSGLIDRRFKTPSEVVAHLGAVQAQDFAAAKWAVGLRIRQSTESTIEKAFNEGAILRTHILRPTWHFVLPEDIRWMLDLTAPRIKRVLATYDRKLDLDDALLAKSNRVIVQAFHNQTNLTRQELKADLERAGIQTNVQRLAHIVVRAELDGLICSGPMRGKQLTYALLEKRAPRAGSLVREEAMAKLASRYFRSHGPAQIKDFSWWSGLLMNDAREAIDLIKTELVETIIDGRRYWFTPPVKMSSSKSPGAFLLSIYDEYTIAYKDRTVLSEGGPRDIERMISMGSAFTAVIILNGKVAGTWKKSLNRTKIEIALQPFREFSRREQQLLDAEIARYLAFLGA